MGTLGGWYGSLWVVELCPTRIVIIVEMTLADRDIEREKGLANAVKSCAEQLNISIRKAAEVGLDVKLEQHELHEVGAVRHPILNVWVRGSII